MTINASVRLNARAKLWDTVRRRTHVIQEGYDALVNSPITICDNSTGI